MTKKTCLIRQPAGLGDIILCQKIADYFIDVGFIIHWPVIDEYYEPLKKHIGKEGLVFYKEHEDFPLKTLYENRSINYPVASSENTKLIEEKNQLYLPLQMADQHFPGKSALKSKFSMLSCNVVSSLIDSSDWQKHFVFVRDKEKENSLFYEELGLSEEEDYILVSNLYGSPPTTLKKEIPLNTNLRVVEVTMLDGYSMFDWSKVIENASEIYCVDTSIFYLIDMLKLKAEKLEAYSKFEPANYMHIEGLFKAPWNYND